MLQWDKACLNNLPLSMLCGITVFRKHELVDDDSAG
jgi:hypothetical protein